MIKVSVVIPTYNRRTLLHRAVESALQQEGVEVEVIIADDGSTDGTAEDWRDRADVRYLSLPHAGACAARNAGIQAATGAYIAFLDSDDTWRRDKLLRQWERLTASGADVVACAFCRHEIDGSETQVPKPDFPEGPVDRSYLLKENCISTQVLFGTAACIKATAFDAQLPRMQDWDYVLTLTQTYRLDLYQDVLADVYVQQDSISRNTDSALQALRRIFAKNSADYHRDYASTEAMLDAIALFAARKKRSAFRDCFRGMSADFSFAQNRTLLIRCAKAALRGLCGITK